MPGIENNLLFRPFLSFTFILWFQTCLTASIFFDGGVFVPIKKMRPDFDKQDHRQAG
ncbi:hypothetical protein GbCGDNIH3_5114 [Granulibacter bethesdensis]|uniref:Uncharacterized protein n=1 Tax=Granulibacter bethesdensis TaxID=364410 RepID=A0AAN0VH24_9PROT|nr:hypothetical protein GbCGDNIH3_5114 [Granulibacter bethesdensis]